MDIKYMTKHTDYEYDSDYYNSWALEWNNKTTVLERIFWAFVGPALTWDLLGFGFGSITC
jgi:hypothetical protein